MSRTGVPCENAAPGRRGLYWHQRGGVSPARPERGPTRPSPASIALPCLAWLGSAFFNSPGAGQRALACLQAPSSSERCTPPPIAWLAPRTARPASLCAIRSPPRRRPRPTRRARLTHQRRARIPRAARSSTPQRQSAANGSISQSGLPSAPARCAIDVSTDTTRIQPIDDRAGIGEVVESAVEAMNRLRARMRVERGAFVARQHRAAARSSRCLRARRADRARRAASNAFRLAACAPTTRCRSCASPGRRSSRATCAGTRPASRDRACARESRRASSCRARAAGSAAGMKRRRAARRRPARVSVDARQLCAAGASSGRSAGCTSQHDARRRASRRAARSARTAACRRNPARRARAACGRASARRSSAAAAAPAAPGVRSRHSYAGRPRA